MLRLMSSWKLAIATVQGNANPLYAAADTVDLPALLRLALAKLKTVTVQMPLKWSILTRRMTVKTERSETYSMDKGVCALNVTDNGGQLKVMNSIS